MSDSSDAQGYLPLTETTFFILLSLAPRPGHGYKIMKEVAALSAGRVALTTGTLYGAIKRLLEQGWIERVGSLQADEGGRPRKEYRLTELGRRILDAEIVRLQGLLQAARWRTSGGKI